MRRFPSAIGEVVAILLICCSAAAADERGNLYYEVDGGAVVFTNTPTGADARALPGWGTANTVRPSPALAVVTRWDPYIAQAAQSAGISRDLLKAVVRVESAFDARAVSPKGALGLMQLMPATAAEYGVGDPFDAWQNLHAGARHLRRMLDDFGDLDLALAAYNAGAGAVRRHGGVPNYAETRDYVRKVRGLLGSRVASRSRPPAAATARRVAPVRMERDASGAFVIRN